jgi:hypothetical protein
MKAMKTIKKRRANPVTKPSTTTPWPATHGPNPKLGRLGKRMLSRVAAG